MRKTKGKRIASFMVAAAMLAGAMFPAAAMGASANGSVSITLKSGNPSITINGVASSIVAPYEQSGTTMVPLRVITEAFDAALTYDKGVIGLTYGDRSIVLTIGSNKVTVNGTVQQVAVAPALIGGGTTYVPLRIIAEAFGADVKFDQATKAVTITGSTAAAAGGEQPSGAALIGSSYDGWQINDPSLYGLTELETNGNQVTSYSEKLGAVLNIDSYKVDGQLTEEEVKTEIGYWFEEGAELISEDTVTVNGVQFVQMITKEEVIIREYRAAQKGDVLYFAELHVAAESVSGLAPYEELLDSFELKFDGSEAEDLVGSVATYTYPNGISITMPQYWFAFNGEEEVTDYVDYYFHGGNFSIVTYTADEKVEYGVDVDGTGIVGEDAVKLPDVTIDGRKASAFQETLPDDEDVTAYYYLVERDGGLVLISIYIEEGDRAEANLKEAQEVLQSITFE